MFSKRPTLIFGENHSDPITRKILLKISPKLASLGYKCFFLEAPEIWTLEEQKKYTDERLKLARELMSDNVTDEKIQRSLRYFNEKFLQNNLSDIESTFVTVISRVRADEATKSFLEALPKFQMGYQGIDLDVNLTTSDYAKIEALQEDRDKKMAAACLNAEQPIFGLIGIKHIMGIQNEILKAMSYKTAADKFSFFSIFSTPLSPYSMFDIFLEEKMRANKIEFPLDVSLINGMDKSEDEIINIILSEIEMKQRKSTEKYPLNRLFMLAESKSFADVDGSNQASDRSEVEQRSVLATE